MKRNSLFFVATFAALVFSAPTGAEAQSATDMNRNFAGRLAKDSADLRVRANTLRKEANSTKDPAKAQSLRDQADALDIKADEKFQKAIDVAEKADRGEQQARDRERQDTRAGITDKVKAVEAAMDGEARREATKARAERDREMYDKPGFWDKVGDKATDALFSMISKLIEQWIAGGGQDDDLLNQINGLQDERDRLLNERENPTDSEGVGRIITDPNGNYGYDRDGDGFVDIPLNPDGSPAGPFDPTNPNGYNSTNGLNGDAGKDGAGENGLAGLAGLPGLSGGGGGAGRGGNFGSFGSGGVGGATGGNGLNGGEEVNGFPGASAGDKDGDGFPDADGDDEGGSGSTKSKKGDDDDERDIETIMGRVVILPKIDAEEEIAGDREDEGGDWSNDFEEWGDDDWDDSADNGDKDKALSEDDFAGGKVGDAKEAAKLVEEVAQVETVIQEWRKAEGEDAEESDPYGFQDDEMAGYRASGEDKKDPFRDVRDLDGNIDVTKVNVWVIHRDSWKEGKTPIRYKIKAPLDLKDFTPIHGGVLVAKGIIEDLDVKDSVMDTIKGKVKKVELVSVILSAEKAPDDLDSLDPSKTKDSDVGGLEDEELEGFDDSDEDW